jgi:hypothetical protein
MNIFRGYFHSKSNFGQKSTHPTVQCAGSGVVVVFLSHKPWLWYGYEAVRSRVKKSSFLALTFDRSYM